MSKKPKIAVLIDWYLPGTKAGGPVRSVYSLIHLLRHEFDFYVLTANHDLGSPLPYTDIKANTWSKHQEIPVYYFSPDQLQTNALQKILEELQPSLIYLNSFWSYPFSIQPIRLKHKGTFPSPILLAPRGMLGQGALGLKAFKKQAFLKIGRLFGWYKRIPFHATQQGEASDILREFPSAKVFLAPNVNALPVAENLCPKVKGKLKVFYLSRVARVKNLHQAIQILSLIPNTFRIQYHIFGNMEDPSYWKECEALIQKLPAHIEVNYQGELEFGNIQNTLVNYHCLLLPTLNENYGHSIVESLLCGCPVIISDQTPWNDLQENQAGYAIPLNKPEAFAEALCAYADMEQESFSQKSKAANIYISKKIDLKSITEQYKTLFHDCIKNGSVNL